MPDQPALAASLPHVTCFSTCTNFSARALPAPRIWSAVSLPKLIPRVLLLPSRALQLTYKHYFLHLALSTPCFARPDSPAFVSSTIFKATPVIARMHRPLATRNLLNLRFASCQPKKNSPFYVCTTLSHLPCLESPYSQRFLRDLLHVTAALPAWPDTRQVAQCHVFFHSLQEFLAHLL
ncbi:hypothetical protein KCU85_g88, partial [Aureobasidium melanogenum]